MKAEKRQRRLSALIFGAIAAFGGIGCMVTGLRFDGISMVTVAIVCVLTAAVCAATAGRKLFPVVPAVLVFACLWLWQKGTLALSTEALLNHISHLYDLGYGWGVIRWSKEAVSADMAQLALCLLGALIALGVSWSFLRCKGIWLTALLVSVPVIPCMLLTDTVPSARYVFVQLLCLVLLLLIRLARKQGQDTALLKLLALPVAAAVWILFVCMPQEEYTALEPVDTVIGRVQAFFTDSSKEAPQTPVRQESDWVNLASVGPKSDRQTAVMEVLAQQTGYLYLKGAAYDTYQGTWWDCQGAAAALPQHTGRILSARITTKAIHDVLYLPYGAYSIASADLPDALVEENGRVKNAGPWHSYTVRYYDLPTYDANWQIPVNNVPQQFTQLPRDTLAAAKDYLAREGLDLAAVSAQAVWSKAQAIVEHVSQSAYYSLQTQKMPSDSDDFAMWFLEESDTGYCVHFASAATVLLRAAGIPARYVAGYLVNARDSHIAEVTESNAHAWVECYIGNVGWVPLEPTPGNGVANTASGEATEPTQTTESPETTAPTEATPTASTDAPQTLPTDTEDAQNVPSQSSPQPSEGTSNIGGADGPTEKPREMPGWLKWAIGALCAACAVIGQWRLRVKLRMQQRSRGRRNAQALSRWQEVRLHCRVRREEPDSRLYELAQKARFSHHTVTREELQEFDAWLTASIDAIRHLPFWKKLLVTILYALY